MPELEILGHVVMKSGRKVAEGKKNKVLSWLVPTTATDILKFLGLCSCVRMFIKDFAELSKPLRHLARKGEEWDWTQECQSSFEGLKEKVGKEIVLKHIDYGPNAGVIRLKVDSSYMAAGAVLAQEEGGKDRPVLYESLTFSDVESR